MKFVRQELSSSNRSEPMKISHFDFGKKTGSICSTKIAGKGIEVLPLNQNIR